MNTPFLLLALCFCRVSTVASPGQPELDDIAADIIAQLACSPTAPRLGSPEGWSHSLYLDLTADWPDPHFRRALVRLSNHDNPAIAAAAGVALSRYPDTEAKAIVERLRQDKRSAGSLTVAKLINRADDTRRASTPVTADLSLALRACLVEPGMSELDVPHATKLLEREDDQDALLGFAWLASRGIVLTTDPLMRQWDRLEDSTRVELLRCLRNRPYIWGNKHLAHALWKLFERRESTHMGEQALAELLDTMLYLGGEVEVLVYHTLDDGSKALPDADRIRAIAPRLTYRSRNVPDDSERALAWLQSMNGNLQDKAMRNLRSLPSGQVQQAVTDFFWTRLHSGDGDMRSMIEFVKGGRCDQSDRKHYVRMLALSLSLSATRLNEMNSRLNAARCVVALEMLTGEVLAPSPSRQLGPDMEHWSQAVLISDPSALRRAAVAWAQWVQDHAYDDR